MFFFYTKIYDFTSSFFQTIAKSSIPKNAQNSIYIYPPCTQGKSEDRVTVCSEHCIPSANTVTSRIRSPRASSFNLPNKKRPLRRAILIYHIICAFPLRSIRPQVNRIQVHPQPNTVCSIGRTHYLEFHDSLIKKISKTTRGMF